MIYDDFKIVQDERNPYIYTIEFSPYINSEPLLHSITKTNILIGTTITNDYKTLQFKAISVKSFTQYKEEQLKKNHYGITYQEILLLLNNLVTQMEYLIKHTKHTFIGYHPKNIIVVDDNKYIYLSNEHLHSIKNDNILLTCPFTKKDFFFSPELEKIKEIPSKIHYKTSYYSLACLIIDVFKEQEDQEEMNALSIKNTKLYWLLKRCLHEEPNKRSILFI